MDMEPTHTERPADEPLPSLLWVRLAKYILGGLSAQERADFERWVVADPTRAADVAAARAARAESVGDDDSVRTARALARVAIRTGLPFDHESALTTSTTRAANRGNDHGNDRVTERAASRVNGVTHRAWFAVPRGRRWIPVTLAAAVLALVAIRVAPWKTAPGQQSTVALRYTTYATHAGEVAHLILADGSHVTVAPNSVFGVSQDFMHGRDVTVLGEVTFDVVPGRRTPFLVHTGVVTTRVLGTTFTVQRDAGTSTTRVSVSSGKVMVGGRTPQHPSVTLTAGMTGLVSDSSAATARTEDLPYVGWMDGQLVFRRAPTADVLAAITRWYGYQFRLTDSSLARRNLTLGLSTESSTAALATLKQVLDVELTFDHDTVMVHPKHSPHAMPRASRRVEDSLSTTQLEVGR
jgi:ferric-dicitrate binding protein FerR (iron transport regulator)